MFCCQVAIDVHVCASVNRLSFLVPRLPGLILTSQAPTGRTDLRVIGILERGLVVDDCVERRTVELKSGSFMVFASEAV